MEYTNREIIEIYLIGSVILFTLSVAGTFLISFISSPIDLLIPFKTLSLYTVAAFIILNYVTYSYLEGAITYAVLAAEVIVELAAATVFLPHLLVLFSETKPYSMTGYPPGFMLLPGLSLLFAIIGVFVVIYYSVDI